MKSQIVDAICTEITLRNNELSSNKLKTIYFGGGTPSLLSEKELYKIFETIHRFFSFDEKIEITIECNPEDISKEKLLQYKKLNINRLSLGVQSFFDEDLQLMKRIHNAQQSEFAIKTCQNSGFDNLTVDLIYGSQTTTDEVWLKNLQKIKDYNINHFSAYALTSEPKTLLAYQIQSKQMNEISDEKQWKHFNMLQDFASENHFIQYEISNLGKEDYFSIHNFNYWLGKEYIGIGPSAHSFNGKNVRKFNLQNNPLYTKNINAGNKFWQEETLTEAEQYNEAIMLGLRTIFGVSLEKIKTFSTLLQEHFYKEIQFLLTENKLHIEENSIKIPQENWFQADGIASQLFWV